MLHILWKAVSLDLFLWPTASEWLQYLLTCILSGILPQFMNDYYILYIQISWKWAYCDLFYSSFFYVVMIDCKMSFQLIYSHIMWSFLSLSLISRWVVLLDDIHNLIISLNTSPCLETSNSTLKSRYFCSFFLGSTKLMELQEAYWLPMPGLNL